jgi:hypothetical protein
VLPSFLDPGRVLAGDERPDGDVLGDSGGDPGCGPVSPGVRGLGAVKRFSGRLDVDPGIVGKS